MSSPWATRLDVATAAVRAAGAALMQLRGTIRGEEAAGGQLKTSTDLAAEGWVCGFLEGTFPGELFLAEERFERVGTPWPGASSYWAVDALDGTRSYVDGYDGFCVQVAYIDGGQPRVGVIGEPVTGAVYVAASGAGAWRLDDAGARELRASSAVALVPGLRFVDSTTPSGPVGAIFQQVKGRFVECGSVGLKICRVAEDAADVYAKQFNYKLWDVAPGEVLLREVGAVLTTYSGETIDYAGARTHFPNLVVARPDLATAIIGELQR
ncbi:MAG TPA: inositol monophosphatase family protein [Kofleriaceae bacterium]|nr:inositol monophosphatase family protein [Kofleriaceae bacterium]